MGGSEEEEEHPGFFVGGQCAGCLGVGSASHSVNIWAFELILLFTRVDGLFCLGPRETITTSIVETLYSYPEKQLLLVKWIHYRFWSSEVIETSHSTECHLTFVHRHAGHVARGSKCHPPN